MGWSEEAVRANLELAPGGHGGPRSCVDKGGESAGAWGASVQAVPGEASGLRDLRRVGGAASVWRQSGSGDRRGPAHPARAHSEASCASCLFGEPFSAGVEGGAGVPALGAGRGGPSEVRARGRGSGAATVGRAQRQEDVRLALEGGAAVGEPLAAPQLRGHVCDTHGLGAGGG